MGFTVNTNREFVGDQYKNVLNKDTNEVLAFPINMSDSAIDSAIEADSSGRPNFDVNPSFYQRIVQPALEQSKITGNNNILYDARKKALAVDPFLNAVKSGFSFGLLNNKSPEAIQEGVSNPIEKFAGDLVGQTGAILATGGIGDAAFGISKTAQGIGFAARGMTPMAIRAAQVGSGELLPKVAGEAIRGAATSAASSGMVGALYEGIKASAEQGKALYDDVNGKLQQDSPDLVKIGQSVLHGFGLWALYGGAGGAFVPKTVAGVTAGTSAVAGTAYVTSKAEGASEPDALLSAAVMGIFHAVSAGQHTPEIVGALRDTIIPGYVKAENGMTGINNIHDLVSKEYLEGKAAELLQSNGDIAVDEQPLDKIANNPEYTKELVQIVADDVIGKQDTPAPSQEITSFTERRNSTSTDTNTPKNRLSDWTDVIDSFPTNEAKLYHISKLPISDNVKGRLVEHYKLNEDLATLQDQQDQQIQQVKQDQQNQQDQQGATDEKGQRQTNGQESLLVNNQSESIASAGINPVEGSGKIAKAASDINKKIVEKGFEELSPEDQAQFNPITKEKTIEDAANSIQIDYEKSKDMAAGREQFPDGTSGAYKQVLFNAVKNKAIAEGDGKTLIDLAVSPLAKERSVAAQTLGASGFDNGMKEADPVKAVQDIINAKQKVSANDDKYQKAIKALEDKVKETQKALDEYIYQSKLKPTKKQEFSKNRLFTKEVADAARESVNKKLLRFHSGIDPTILVDLTKIGGAHVEAGIRDFAEWSKKMIDEFGENIRPYLTPAWDSIQNDLRKFEKDNIIEKIKGTADLSESSYQIGKLSEMLVSEGITERDALVKSVHDILKESMPDLTTREVVDAISGYGKYKKLNPDEVKAKLRDIKGQLQQISKLEDIKNKQSPLKTGIERRIPSDEERQLIKQVEDAKKEYGIETTNPEIQLKSALDSIKTRLRNNISDLEKQIKSKTKIDRNNNPIPYDQEAKDLRAKRDALKEEYSKLFGEKKLTDEQKIKIASGSLEKSITDYERRIKEKDIAVKRKGEPLQTPELIQLRAKRDALKEELQQIKDSINPKKTKEEIALQTLKKRLERETIKLNDRLSNLDFSKREPNQTQLDEEALRLKTEHEKARQAYNAAKELKETITVDEANKITELANDVSKSKELIEPDSPIASPERLTYGRARADFEDYVNDLKSESSKTKIADYLKPKNYGKAIIDLGGLAKSMKASLDDSVIGRQGLKTLLTQPDIWLKNSKQSFVDIWDTFGGKEVMREVRADILSRPNSLNGLYAKERLAVGVTEEAYPTNLPEKIPVVGRAFKASETAFTAFQYRTRADVFDRLVEIANNTGADIQGIGKVVNSLTGRGSIGVLEPSAKFLNNIFFSPRFVKSNIDTLTGHLFSKDLGSFARRQAVINTIKIIAGIAGMLAISKVLDKKSVDEDPRSANFGKIRVGDTRFDVSGGMSSLVTLASRLIPTLWGKGSTKSSVTKLVTPLNSDKFGAKTGQDVLIDFLDNKTSPLASVLVDRMLKGKDRQGNKPSLASDANNLLSPLALTNYVELSNNPNSANILVAILADELGIGTNTYGEGANWMNTTGKELIQFKAKVGDVKFKEANDTFNQRYNEWFNKAIDNPKYDKLSDEDKQKILIDQKDKIKDKIFKEYNFKYRKEKSDKLPTIK